MSEAQEQPFNMADVFKNREKLYDENPHLTDAPVQPEPKKERTKNEQEVPPIEQKPKEVKAADDVPKEPEKDYKKELERAEKRIADNRNWGEKKSRENSAYRKNVRTLIEEGVINEEEGTRLLSHIPEDTDSPLQANKGFFSRLGEILEEEVTHMKRYVDVPDIDDDISSFKQFLALGELAVPGVQRDQYEAIIEELAELEQEGDRVALLKRVLNVGRDYNDIFKEIREIGDLRFLKQAWEKSRDEERASHQKDIDKLTKELDKLKRMTEDYTESPTRLSGSGGFARKNEDTGPSDSLNLDHLFKNREAYFASYRGK